MNQMSEGMAPFQLLRFELDEDVWKRLERNTDKCTAPAGYFTGVDKGGHPYREIASDTGRRHGRIVHLIWSIAAYDTDGKVLRAFIPSEWERAEKALEVAYKRRRGANI